MLVDEIAKRTGIRLSTSTEWPKRGAVIAITAERTATTPAGETRPEGYRLYVDERATTPAVWLIGADPRGALFAAGNLLRRLDWGKAG